MSSDEISIRVQDLGKRYEIYSSPRERLKQFVLPPVQRLIGRSAAAHYKEHWALKDISFEIKKGEAFGIVGRNGSGKSTLLQIITGTLAPTVGEVTTKGRIAALLELGSGFNPEFSGRENVYLNAMLLGMTRDQVDERFDRIAAFADIGDYLEQPVKTYSSGMLVRLAFAVQVQIDPDILIVDEALAVGDALFQKRCFARIEKLLSDGVTLLFVSHDQESVRTLTHRAILLKNGHEVLTGSSSEVLLSYRKLLHEEESAYFSRLKPKQTTTSEESKKSAISNNTDKDHSLPGRSDSLSFGDGGIEVTAVKTFDTEGEPCAVFYPGDAIKIRVSCRSAITTDHINVSIRIRSREGIKIYSWGTLNQDMQILSGARDGEIFWTREIQKNEEFDVWLECSCILGPNFYEIQAAVSYEGKPDYTEQRILHWKDEAAFFQALIRQNEYTFGGMTDLRMKATW
ncbi:ABC transporter ATP-binding protein [Rhizobium sp. LEGMi135b]